VLLFLLLSVIALKRTGFLSQKPALKIPKAMENQPLTGFTATFSRPSWYKPNKERPIPPKAVVPS